jgi:NAD(P)-dependent dehydrogenase (short-subunit alcohol dehydrogenase family)
VLPNLLEGKVAVITGASQGLGAATGRYFAAAGAKVVLAARRIDKLEEIAREVGDQDSLAVRTDVSDEASVKALIDRAVERFGRIDVAVNNAVGGGPMPAALADVETADFDSAYAVNLRGTFLCLKYQIRAMLESGQGGAIINVLSTAGVRAWPGLAAYSATKHGIGGLTAIAALDYAPHRIRVNAIAPGPIDTDRIAGLPEDRRAEIKSAVPLGRIATPHEVAALAAWLCSDQASYITGTTVAIDGGQLARV